jgi:hypothetical protein
MTLPLRHALKSFKPLSVDLYVVCQSLLQPRAYHHTAILKPAGRKVRHKSPHILQSGITPVTSSLTKLRSSAQGATKTSTAAIKHGKRQHPVRAAPQMCVFA